MTIFLTPLVLFSVLLPPTNAARGVEWRAIVLQLTDASGSVTRVTVRPGEAAVIARLAMLVSIATTVSQA